MKSCQAMLHLVGGPDLGQNLPQASIGKIIQRREPSFIEPSFINWLWHAWQLFCVTKSHVNQQMVILLKIMITWGKWAYYNIYF